MVSDSLLIFRRFRMGSALRGRGKGAQQRKAAGRDRITPACAGKSLPVDRAFQRLGDHPRVCGEKGEEDNRPEEQGGSPPRVRGKVTLISIP